MNQLSSVKYLCYYLHEKGLAKSAHLTVMQRKGIVTRDPHKIKTVFSDCRVNTTGKITSGIDLWETTL